MPDIGPVRDFVLSLHQRESLAAYPETSILTILSHRGIALGMVLDMVLQACPARG